MFYLQMPETAPKKQLTNKSSYPCVKVAEPSYSGYIVWKVFTTPTTLLNHLTDFTLSDGFIDSSINSAGIIKGLTNVHTAPVGH